MSIKNVDGYCFTKPYKVSFHSQVQENIDVQNVFLHSLNEGFSQGKAPGTLDRRRVRVINPEKRKCSAICVSDKHFCRETFSSKARRVNSENNKVPKRKHSPKLASDKHFYGKTTAIKTSKRRDRKTEICLFLAQKDLFFSKNLGEGAYSVVDCYSELDRKGNVKKQYAVKFIKEEKISKDSKWFSTELSSEGELFRGEALGLCLPNHPYVLKTCKIVIFNEETGTYRLIKDFSSIEKKNNQNSDVVVAVLTECIPGSQDLSSFLHNRQLPLTAMEIKKFGKQIAEGLAFIHGQRLSHRDIKSQNILLDSNGVAKIMDFGFARRFKKTSDMHRTNSFCGSCGYMAPEIFLQKDYGQQADAWSFGILLYKMAFGRYPSFFNHLECEQMPVAFYLFIQIDQTVESFDKNLCRGAELGNDSLFWDLLNKLICCEEKRISMQQVCAHPFFLNL